jgi:hypothetical protein
MTQAVLQQIDLGLFMQRSLSGSFSMNKQGTNEENPVKMGVIPSLFSRDDQVRWRFWGRRKARPNRILRASRCSGQA